MLLRLQKRSRPGYFDPAPLRRLTGELFSRYRPAADFGLVLVELPFLRSRLISGPAVTASHLMATASIPIAMPAVSIAGQTFTDGGLLEDVPIWAAVRMGATRIIAVDAMHFDCPWWFRAGVSPLGLLAPRVAPAIRARVTLIRPPEPLGDYQEALNWNRSRIENWMDRGYADASRALSEPNHSAASLIASPL